MVPLLDQFYYFAFTVLIGVVAGFCYDLYKVTRGTLRLRKIGTALGDVLFWIVLTGVVFTLLLMSNWGEVRLYVFLGLVLGAVIYLSILSRSTTSLLQLTFKTIRRLWKFFIRLLDFVWRLICLPFRFLYLAVAVPLGLVTGLLGKITHKLFGKPLRSAKRSLRSRLSSIFPIFEYKDHD